MRNKDVFFLNGDEPENEERPDTGEVTPEKLLNHLVNAAVEDYAEQVELPGPLHVTLIIDDEETHQAKNEARYSLADFGYLVSDLSNEKAYYVVSILNDIIPRMSIVGQALFRSYSENNIHRELYKPRIQEIMREAALAREHAMRMTDLLNELAFTAIHQYNYELNNEDIITPGDEDDTSDDN